MCQFISAHFDDILNKFFFLFFVHNPGLCDTDSLFNKPRVLKDGQISGFVMKEAIEEVRSDAI